MYYILQHKKKGMMKERANLAKDLYFPFVSPFFPFIHKCEPLMVRYSDEIEKDHTKLQRVINATN